MCLFLYSLKLLLFIWPGTGQWLNGKQVTFDLPSKMIIMELNNYNYV